MKLLTAESSALPMVARTKHRVIQGDALDFTHDYRGELFHSMFCDPPYHLTSITDRFGSADAAPAKFGKDGAFARASKGFMGKDWDGGDLVFRPETWATFSKVLLPGAFGMAFASTRGFARMACAIEDAGFILHPMIVWIQGQGFPKATRVKGDPRFEGHRYGGQAMKPSLEPICVFQKPYIGRTRDCITGSGAGTINIDGGRIEGPAWNRSTPWKNDIRGGNFIHSQGIIEFEPQEMDRGGRWPSNLELIHSPDCTDDQCVPMCPVQMLGDQAGERSAGGNIVDAQSEPMANIYSGRFNRQRNYEGYGDDGSAARFFHTADWSQEVAEQLEVASPFLYMPKAGKDERNRGLDHFDYQQVNDGRKKAIDNAYQRGETQRLNTHPTIKPINLAIWLAKLLLPPAEFGPRRLFIPFCGSGSEIIGASLAGWETIYGVELSHEYASIARARLDYYDDPMRSMRLAVTEPEIKQPSLFEVQS